MARIWLICFFVALALPLIALAQHQHEALASGTGGYLRLLENAGQEVALQTSITRFAGASGGGPVVDLVSAVHVGDRAYYAALNQLFRQYDVVLYELVAEPAQRISGLNQGADTSSVSKLQGGLKHFLDLSHQLDEVDYSAANFVHADFTPAQFAASMAQRGESLFLIVLDTWLKAMTTPGLVKPVSDVELLRAIFADNRALAFKLLLARQFAEIDGVMKLLAGGDDGSTLITGRNLRALEVLEQQLRLGHQSLAIFYGAGHMADFETRLGSAFGLQPVSRNWLDAWNLRESAPDDR